ncbi:MAG: hypothetical protein HY222_06965 [Thaumarchaeota archaeon]|nr:hypothetical protein [Nitrososphaerota archaeon]MBI3642116.1 hypothetical protein [Nitrososphaerota archaeon]
MPLSNSIIISLNEITTSVSSKKRLKPEDETMIKGIFQNMLESGGIFNIDEIESWFALEGSWHDKSTVERILNIAHYQQAKYDANNKLKFMSDDCSCGKS